MKFFSMIIDLPRSQYEIVYQPSLAQRLAIWLTILAIVVISLQSGFEHVRYTVVRKTESIAVNLVSQMIAPTIAPRRVYL